MLASPKAAILATFAAFGAFVGSHAGALPVLLAMGQVDPQVFGFYQFANMLMGLVGMALGGLLNRVLDHRTVILIMLPTMFLSVAAALSVNSSITFGLSLMMLGFMYSFLDLFMNAEATIVEEGLRRPVFGLFHGTLSLLLAGFGLLAGMLSSWFAPWAILPVTAIPTALAFALVWQNIPASVPVTRVRDETYVALPRLKLTLIGLAAGLGNVGEMAAISWSGSLLAHVKPELAAYSGLGVAFYGLCSGLMRISSDTIRARIGDYALVRFSLCAAILGFALLSFSPGFWLSAVAFAGVGAGLSTVFPSLFAISGRLVPQARAAAMGFMAVVMAPPRIIMPLLLGVLASRFGFESIFAACMVVSIASLAIVVFFLRDIMADAGKTSGAGTADARGKSF
jgi:Major Facilitator Superfamily